MTSDFHVGRAARCVLSGGVVAYPTEAVYGLGCLPRDVRAVAKLLAIKQRDWRKGLLLIAADLDQLSEYATLPDGDARRRVLDSWPGPHTWLLDARPATPVWITGPGTAVGIRITAHPVARRLCERVGSAIVSTSANVAGRPPITRPLALRRQLGTRVDAFLPGDLGDLGEPTRIVDARSGRVVRASGNTSGTARATRL